MAEGVFFEVHRDLPREGPGSRAATARALALAGPLPSRPAILDLGCGPGAQTIDLAELIPDARVTALDAHPPFLRELNRRAMEHGVATRVDAVEGDMARLDYASASFDLIWCEGAAYIIGFDAALKAWRPLLRPGGALALSEPVWLTDDPPAPAHAFWAAAYPAMRSPAALRSSALAAGYQLLGDFALPESAWWDDYYTPMERRLDQLERWYRGDADTLAKLKKSRREIACYRVHAVAYGYCFLVLRADR